MGRSKVCVVFLAGALGKRWEARMTVPRRQLKDHRPGSRSSGRLVPMDRTDRGRWGRGDHQERRRGFPNVATVASLPGAAILHRPWGPVTGFRIPALLLAAVRP